MSLLSGFNTKNFIQQISLLDEVEQQGRIDEIPALLELYQGPLDDAVDQAVSDTLRALLRKSEPDTVACIDSEDERSRNLAIYIAGEMRYPGAVPRLVEVLKVQKGGETPFKALSALAKIAPQDHLPLFYRYVNHPDPILSALSVEVLGQSDDDRAYKTLCKIVSDAETGNRYEDCDLRTSKAIMALGARTTQEALAFLAENLHHKNPSARRLVLETLVEVGESSIPHLAPLFNGDDVDLKILAANTLGFIGHRDGGNVLVSALDLGVAADPNVRYAIYEALGRISFLKGMVCLLDGLKEDDTMLLMAVVTSLDGQVNPGVVDRVNAMLTAGDDQSKRVVRALVAAKAGNLFRAVYEAGIAQQALLEAVATSNDPQAIETFRNVLTDIDSEAARSDAEQLADTEVRTGSRRVLAVDDSKSMLLFYRSVAAGLGVEVETAPSGREALDLVEQGLGFDLVITDLNMPVMDGVQLTQQLREGFFLPQVPILMVTTESDGSQVQLAKKAGVTDFVRKPLTPDILKAKIDELLGS